MRLLVVLAFALLGSVVAPASDATAAGRTDVEVDSDAAGGDGVAGQVIGSFTTGYSVVNATSRSDHVSAEGGDAGTATDLRIIDQEHPRSIAVDAAAGDGVAAQVAGAGETDFPLPTLGLSHTDVSVFGLAVLFDVGP